MTRHHRTGKAAAQLEARSLSFGQNQRGHKPPRGHVLHARHVPTTPPALGLVHLAHPGVSPNSSLARSRRPVSFIGDGASRPCFCRTKGAFFAQGRAQHTCPPLARLPVPPGLGGTAGTAPVPRRQQPRQLSRPPSRCRSWRRLHTHHLLLPSFATRCSRLLRAAGRSCLPPHPWVPLALIPQPSTPGAHRTICRRNTESPMPMDRKLQLRHSEKNVPRATRAAFCLLQIPEPDPFSLWV